MALKVQRIDELDPALVRQLQSEFAQLLQERYPEVELTRGVVHDVIAHLAGGVSGAVNQTEIQRVLDAQSLLAISLNPVLADAAIVDNVLSNHRITRRAGQLATGTIAVVVVDDTAVVVPAGAAYAANGITFIVDSSFVIKPPGSQLLSPDEKNLEPRGDGTYTYTVPATAVTEGADGNIRRGTKLTPEPVPARFVTAFAATDFTGGAAVELNDALLKRMELGIAAQVMQGRKNIVALIQEQEQFATTHQFSIIGYGNPEMHRDQHWIFPVSGGGRLDIYARTLRLPVSVRLTRTCVLIDRVAGGSVWQFSLDRDAAPGFYDIVQILRPDDPPEAAGFEITYDARGFDLNDEPLAPDVLTVDEAAYSRYQTGVFRFLDEETDTSEMAIGDTAAYIVVARGMPLLAPLQEFCAGTNVRNLMADILVKAPVPCFLSVNFDIEQAAGESSPDTEVIRNAVADAVNNLEFPGQLHTSVIADVVHGYLTRRQAVGPIELHGKIRRPDGTITYVRSHQTLKLPDTPSAGVTGRTTALLLDPSDIGVNVVTKGFEENI